ncbi:MAG: AbrB/MazE/SpoVT family DNA-binding domain-containing protein [Candidatus Micrarchaeia archaeon]|jgi:AbrB family looped-hinge helix DNA binding protein
MSNFVTVNVNGQVTLPARDRKKLGILPGSSLCVVEHKDGLLLRKATPVSEDILVKIRRIADEKGLTQKDILKICREVRAEVYKEEYGEG